MNLYAIMKVRVLLHGRVVASKLFSPFVLPRSTKLIDKFSNFYDYPPLWADFSVRFEISKAESSSPRMRLISPLRVSDT